MQPSSRLRRTAAASRALFVLSLCLAAWLWSATPLAAEAEHDITLRWEADRFCVRNGFYEVSICPEAGGRIVSLLFGGVEMTGLCADGHGGLMEEVHSADLPFQVLEQKRQSDGVSLVLAADAGDLRIIREYTFHADRPWFAVTHTFENRSRFFLTGDSAPRIRNLPLPAGGRATGRELYCFAAGRGTRILPLHAFLARPQVSAASLRWIAVTEPASRRALGFALLNGGCRLLPPLKPEGPGLVLGWSHPAVPPGSSTVTKTLVVPLEGFAAVGELNERFIADSLPDFDSEPSAIHLGLMPLREEMQEVSVITRTYDESGRELNPCDALLFDELAPMQLGTGRIAWRAGEQRPAWLLHEVYGKGTRLGQFAVPVGHGRSDFTVRSQQLDPPEVRPIEGFEPPGPGGLIPPTTARKEQGLLLWRFDGAPARSAIEQLDLTLTEGERRTVFLGVKALQPFEKLRFALAGAATESNEVKSVPPAAAYLWQVRDDGTGAAWLSPLIEMALKEGETGWLAFTADAGQLKAGRYGGRLVVSGDSSVSEMPVSLRVMRWPPTRGDPFGLWYLGDETTEPLSKPVLAKLADYGVSGLTVTTRPAPDGRTMRAAVNDAQRRNFRLLAFAGPGGTLPPKSASPGLMLLSHPQPFWLLQARGASPGAARAAAQARYAPALLCERLAAVREGLLFEPGFFPFWLVKDGCEPGRVARMIETGSMDGREAVWLHLDLNQADWRRAATEVRSALWAAAWQGLAGVAVSCPPPPRQADRQSVLWHILRDARREVALWRGACRIAEAAAEAGTATPRAQLLLQELDRTVGTRGNSRLVLKTERRPFRRLYRVTAAPGSVELTVAQFGAARDHVLALAESIETAATAGQPRQLYWQRIPLVEGGRVRWEIVAPDGEASWKTAVAFQKAAEAATGKVLRVSRTFPDPDEGAEDAPLLVWVITDDESGEGLPQPAGAALAHRKDAQVADAQLENGTVVAFIRNNCDLNALFAAFQTQPSPYPPARRVR